MPAKPDPHDWNEINTYFLIHEAYLARAMDEGFVLSHGLDDPLVLPDSVPLEGRIVCQHGIFSMSTSNWKYWIETGDSTSEPTDTTIKR